MAIIRWGDPWRELAGVQERLNRVFGDVYTRRGEDDVMSRGDWMPAVDIYQNGLHELVIKAELPGVKREDIDLRVENNTLTLSGERKMDSQVIEEQYHRIERSYGKFSRSFSVPNTVDTSKVRAEYKEGILVITLPIREEAKPKQISVQVS